MTEVSPTRRRAVCFALMAAALVTSSCVYFNTYYNAQKYFRQAEKARLEEQRNNSNGWSRDRTFGRRQGWSGRHESYHGLYEKAVRKASLVLDKHRDSELVDDAMFLVGRALYWQRDYQYGARSLQDLKDNFPKSEYFDRARLWRGFCLEGLGDKAGASAIYRQLISERSEVGDQGGLRLGEMAVEDAQYLIAIQEFQSALEAFPQSDLRSLLFLRIGETHLEFEEITRADSAFIALQNALQSDPPDSVEYRARLNQGRALYRLDQQEQAIEVYTDLLRESRFRTSEGETRLLVGQYYQERQDLDRALSEFEKVRDDFPQTGVSAKALYHTGLLYLQAHGDRPLAQEYLEEVSQEKRDSEAAELSAALLSTFNELDELLYEIWEADSLISVSNSVQLDSDSDATVSNSIAPKDVAEAGVVEGDLAMAVIANSVTGEWDGQDTLIAFGDSLVSTSKPLAAGRPLVGAPRPTVEDGTPQRSRRSQRQREQDEKEPRDLLLDHLFVVAEIYRDDLGQPDSAAIYYEEIVNRYPESDEVPRALYNLAWIHLEIWEDEQTARPFVDRLVADYPLTAHANGVRERLGMEIAKTAQDLASTEFDSIDIASRRDPGRAKFWIEALDELVDEYPRTETAVKSAFRAAWLQENVLLDSAGAADRFAMVEETYPRSAFAELVRDRREADKSGLVNRLERELRTLGQGLNPSERLELLAVEPDSVDSAAYSKKYLGFALRAHRRGDLELAEDLYQLSLDEQVTRNGRALSGMGDAAWERGWFDESIDYFRRAVTTQSGGAVPFYRLFAYHAQEGDVDSANHYLRHVLRRDRANPETQAVADQFPSVISAEPEPLEISILETITLEPPVARLEVKEIFLDLNEAPMVRTLAEASYPTEAVGDTGSVILDILVDVNGRPDSIKVFSGEDPFAYAAVETVEDYLFYPGVDKKGEEIPVWVEVVISYAPEAESVDSMIPTVAPDSTVSTDTLVTGRTPANVDDAAVPQ
ncbi:MAG: tetratricopeptide repeat protein [Candidatus Latescibacterota bacterium]|nr:tetratricopeptide repeat protein [Candidatus Latescibacterota bacterium]